MSSSKNSTPHNVNMPPCFVQRETPGAIAFFAPNTILIGNLARSSNNLAIRPIIITVPFYPPLGAFLGRQRSALFPVFRLKKGADCAL